MKWWQKPKRRTREEKRLDQKCDALQNELEIKEQEIKDKSFEIDTLQQKLSVSETHNEFLYAANAEQLNYIESLNAVHGYRAGDKK